MKKIILSVFALLLASSLFAFDASTFWKQFPSAVKNGDSIVNGGIGINAYNTSHKPDSLIPAIEVSYEKAMFIANMLPLSFGGYANMYGCKYVKVQDSVEGMPFELKSTMSYTYFNVGGLAKYHFDLGIDKLDTYAGAKVGINILSFNIKDDIQGKDNTNPFSPVCADLGFVLGASYFFTPNMAATLETGFPGFLTAKFTYKF